MAIKTPLSQRFLPSTYNLKSSPGNDKLIVVIEGRRIGRPSKRLALHQSGLKILNVSMLLKSKNKEIEYIVERINHLPLIQEVRLHTAQLQYPGIYTVKIEFSGQNLEAVAAYIKNRDASKSYRTHLPSIDEPNAIELAEMLIIE